MKIAAVAPSVNRPGAEHSRPVEAHEPPQAPAAPPAASSRPREHAPSAGLTRSAVDARPDAPHFSRSSDE